MGVNINPNISAINIRNNISKNNDLVKASLSKLASGNKITSAKDDAAGLAIGTRLDAQLKGYAQQMRSASDGISITQTADGAAGQINSNLQRMRELAVQAGNGALNESDKAAIQQEMDQLAAEIDSISQGTDFNGKALLDGSFSETVDVGGDSGVEISIDDTQVEALGVDSIDVSTQAGVSSALDAIDSAINKISNVRASLGATMNRFESSINNLRTSMVNSAEARSRIMDTDYATETSLLAQAQIKEQAGISMLGQIHNLSPQSVLSLLQ